MTDTTHAQRRGAHRRLKGRDFFSSIESALTGGVGPVSIPTSPATPAHSDTSSSHSESTTSASSSSTRATSDSSTVKTSSQTSSHSSTSSSSSKSSSTSSSTSSSLSGKSSSSSSFSSSSSRSSTSQSSIVVTSNPVATGPSPPTTPVILTSFQTYSQTPSVTATGAVAASTTPSSSVSTGAVVGGVAAGVVGFAGILFAVLYFWRRSHHDHSDIDDFNAQAFKHQSVILPDEGMPSRSGSFNRGGSDDYNPHPPSMMMEQSMGNIPPSFVGAPPLQGYGAQAAYFNNHHPSQPSFNPGQYMTSGPGQVGQPVANPFVAPYGQVPIGSAADGSPYDYAYYGHGQPVNRQPSNGAAQYLSRQPSAGPMQNLTRQPPAGPVQGIYGQPSGVAGASLYRQPSASTAQILSHQPSGGAAQYLGQKPLPGNPVPEVSTDAHYVDLSRSSVTPFQAAQYSEISRRLNIPPPASMPSDIEGGTLQGLAPVAEIAAPAGQQSAVGDKQLPAEPRVQDVAQHESPFSDTQEVHDVDLNAEENEGQDLDMPERDPSFRDSYASLPSPHFEAHDRVASSPPILPEIHLQQRSFSPISADYPVAPSSVRPSPLGESFSPPSPPAQAHFPSTPTIARAPSMSASPRKEAADTLAIRDEHVVKRPDTVYTLYDDDDAYGGI